MRIFNLVKAIQHGFSRTELESAGYGYEEISEAFLIRAYLEKCFGRKMEVVI